MREEAGATPALPPSGTLTVARRQPRARCLATARSREGLRPRSSPPAPPAQRGGSRPGFAAKPASAVSAVSLRGSAQRGIMVLGELWAALSGASGAALACCFVAAAVALRWSGRGKARGAAARARQRQKAALESMDKAAQRFRLQVTLGSGSGGRRVGVPPQHFQLPGRARRGGWQAVQVCGQRRFVTCGTPSCSNAFRALPEPGRAKGRKGNERDREGSFGRPSRH